VPIYRYTAITKAGIEQKGSLDAENLPAARKKLHADGVYPLAVTESREGDRLLPSFSLMGSQDFLPLLTRQLSTLVGAGVPVVSALQALGSQMDDPEVRRMIADLQEAVREGMPFGKAIESHPKMFPELYASMVRAGEEGGMLPLSLSRLADHLEEQARTRNRVRSALTYPILMAIVAAAVVVFLLTVVVPKIVGVFSHLGKALPLPTRILIALTNALTAGWWVLLLLVAGGILLGRRYLATPQGKRSLDSLLLRLPLTAYMFRPGYIQPLGGIRSKTRLYQAAYTLAAPLFPLLRRIAPNQVTTTEVVGRAMIRVAREGYSKRILEVPDINLLGGGAAGR